MSASGASLPAMPSTRHGYASGGGATRGDVAFSAAPVGAASAAAPRSAPKANRRPLIIGLTLAVVGVVVLLVVLVGGDTPPADPGGPVRIRESGGAASSIAELEVTAPTGAELWLDGKRIDFEQGKPVPVTAGHRIVRLVTPSGACEKQLQLGGGQRVPFTCTPTPPPAPAAPSAAAPSETAPAATTPAASD